MGKHQINSKEEREITQKRQDKQKTNIKMVNLSSQGAENMSSQEFERNKKEKKRKK